MAQDTTITLTPYQWNLLTDSDVTSLTFQNRGSSHILVKATVGATAPTVIDGIRYEPGEGANDATLATLFRGVSGANRVWAYSAGKTPVYVSHA